MINNDQSTLLLYCCEDVESHRSGGDTVPLNAKKFSEIWRGGEELPPNPLKSDITVFKTLLKNHSIIIK